MHDGIQPFFAQFLTLELYSANMNYLYNKNNNIKYLFRFTHKGKFIPYEYCYDEYNNDDIKSELCDLNLLLNNGFKDVNITQREWLIKNVMC